MASESFGGIALLSIHPEYARSIIRGEKKAEFRKTRFREKISHVVIYATTPIQKVVGYCEVARIEEGTPWKLWMRHGKVGGILYKEFKKYFGSSSFGVAIRVRHPQALKHPIPLSVVGDSILPPQSFSYLTRKAFETIREYA